MVKKIEEKKYKDILKKDMENMFGGLKTILKIAGFILAIIIFVLLVRLFFS